jgi:hypothetical protein
MKRGRLYLLLVLFGLVIVSLIVIGLDIQKGCLRRDCRLLYNFHSAWVQAGRPVGEAFDKFRTGMRSDVIVTNRTLWINNRPYYSELVATNLVCNNYGRKLYITKNGQLVLESKEGASNLVALRF